MRSNKNLKSQAYHADLYVIITTYVCRYSPAAVGENLSIHFQSIGIKLVKVRTYVRTYMQPTVPFLNHAIHQPQEWS